MNRELINKIKSNNIFTIFSPDEYNQHDELGFDILHYAILFGNDNVVNKILKKDELLPKPVIENYELIYDYSFIASLLGRKGISEKLINNSLYVRDSYICYERLAHSHRSIENSIKAHKRSIERNRKALKSADALNRSQIKTRIKQANNLISLQEKYCELVIDDIKEAESTVARCREFYKEKVCDFKNNLSNTPQIIKLFFDFYSDYQNYNDSEQKIGYFFYGFKFQISESWYLKYNLEKEQTQYNQSSNNKEQSQNYYNNKSNGQSERKSTQHDKEDDKPYGDHWFSDAAWKNIDIMRKEYRVFAKKYHPDNHPEKIKTFMSIQAERAIILDLLK